MKQEPYLEIISMGSYSASASLELDSKHKPEDLKPLLQNECTNQYRRIDRFIQLGLLGSSRCCKNIQLEENTRLYIGSGHGPMSNNVAVQEQLFRDKSLPKPINFINTLSNSLGYYIAKNLNINNQNFFISRSQATLEALFQSALIDFESMQQSSVALIGVVDEFVSPVEQHWQRTKTSINEAVSEGSHWFLVRRTKKAVPENHPILHSTKIFYSESDVLNWIATYQTKCDHYYYHTQQTPKNLSVNKALSKFKPYSTNLGTYPSQTAGTILSYLNSQAGMGLITLFQDKYERFHCLSFLCE